MNDELVAAKPSLDALLTQELHDLINATASTYYRKYGAKNSNSAMISQEDLALEGYLGATTAYQSFNPNLGASVNIARSFRTHAYRYIHNMMMTYCRKFSHQLTISEKAARNEWDKLINIGVVHIDRKISRPKEYTTYDDAFDIPVASGIDEVKHDLQSYFLVGFSTLERDIIQDYLIDGCSCNDVSQKYNISKSKASAMMRRLKERMKQKAENYVQDY